MKKLIAFSDSGHGWIKVKRSELIKLGICDKITSFSYQRGTYVYLEEDCDATTYIEALNKNNITFEIKTKNTNKVSKIRSYESYTNLSF